MWPSITLLFQIRKEKGIFSSRNWVCDAIGIDQEMNMTDKDRDPYAVLQERTKFVKKVWILKL